MIGEINIFNDPHVEIEGKLIRWDSHTCFISAISQLWIGRPRDKKWWMSKEDGDEGLNIELNSGSVQCFLSSSHEFLVQVYEMICKITVEGYCEEKYILDFENNLLKLWEEPKIEEEEEQQPQKETQEEIPSPPKEIMQELLILTEHYKKKEQTDPTILPLLEEIAGLLGGENIKDLHELYKKFIQLSLINDCNELGLNMIISEIKAGIFS